VAAWLPTALVSIAIGAFGQFLLKLAARTGGSLTPNEAGIVAWLLRLAVNPYMILGVVCFVSSMLLWVKVLQVAQLSSSYPLVSLGYVIVAVLGAVFLGEHLAPRQIAAMAVIVLGVALLGAR